MPACMVLPPSDISLAMDMASTLADRLVTVLRKKGKRTFTELATVIEGTGLVEEAEA